MMEDIQTWLTDIWAHEMVRNGARALLIIVAGLVVMRMISRRLKTTGPASHHRLVARRVVNAVVFALTVAWAMSELGLRIGVVLGAAGVFTVAIGFAAQTSFSNLISGLFLMAERPFKVGDIIEVGTTTGEVLSIDLLSIKLCTFDNLLVRIPNETMLKANVTNLTYFPIRRYDLRLCVPYREDLERVRTVLLGAAEDNRLALRNPAPLFLFQRYSELGVELQFSCWATRENFIALRTAIALDVKRAFDASGMVFSVPQRMLEVGPGTQGYLDRAPLATTPGNPDAAPGSEN